MNIAFLCSLGVWIKYTLPVSSSIIFLDKKLIKRRRTKWCEEVNHAAVAQFFLQKLKEHVETSGHCVAINFQHKKTKEWS